MWFHIGILCIVTLLHACDISVYVGGLNLTDQSCCATLHDINIETLPFHSHTLPCVTHPSQDLILHTYKHFPGFYIFYIFCTHSRINNINMSSTAKSTSSPSTQVFSTYAFFNKSRNGLYFIIFLPYYVPISNQCVF